MFFFNCNLSYVVSAKNTVVGPVGPFLSTLILTDYTPNRWFLSDYSLPVSKRVQLDILICPSSWKLYLDDFPFFLAPL